MVGGGESGRVDVPLRLRASSLRLVREAVGGPRAVAAKLRRIVRTLRLYADRDEVDRRLARLEERGYMRARPTRAQVFFGGLDMLRFVIEPAARDYYRQKGISFGFHQLLRVLDDPVSMIDPTGFLSERDTIIGHLMQVTHLRARTIAAVVEDPGYHARLLDYVRRYRADPGALPPVRAEQTIRVDPHFAAAERTFATLPGFIEYCHRLPAGAATLLRRLRRVDRFPLELAAAESTRPTSAADV